MMSMGSIGVSDRPGGESAERARRKQKLVIVGGVFAVGMIVGFLVGFREAEADFLFDRSQPWPPAMAIGIAFSYLAAVIGGGIALSRHTDEYERMAQYKAVAFAALVYMLVYPVWFVLWMGALVPEPHHGLLFGAFWLSLVAASLFYRFR